MATIKRKHLKRTYKIPRDLKKSIKKNLVKIVERREKKIRDEEVSVQWVAKSESLMLTIVLKRKKFSIQHGAIMAEVSSHLYASAEILKSHKMSDELSHALVDLLSRGFHKYYFEQARQQGGLTAQKSWAKEALELWKCNKDLQKEIRVWLVEQGEDAAEVEKLGKKEEIEVQHEVEDEDDALEGSKEYDWTSTSTLSDEEVDQ